MSPRSADPAVRAALLDAAARILATDGPGALSTRRLAAEVGASTMAVYTHFGSMDQVRQAVRRDGFARLGADLDALGRTDDPLADLTAGALTYLDFGLARPELYRAMFVDRPPAGTEDPGNDLFQRLLGTVRRCIDAGRFEAAADPLPVGWAAELWTMQHGMVVLALGEVVPAAQIRFLLTDMTYRLAVGFGDSPAAARRSTGIDG
ncbi:TetR family transcriptional regulator [Actinocatenispora thailandica]|uniref:TetR family transcriptional regulator n=1 Tax=Actinocatenispora thailandica TaxID=227318 RepID=A0A7R7DTB8_9ACTN|nr:TetR/AcrR family transcriptional regulator [Actinocatenispora thailandica]BCJ37390.1 TetR family transcriptional regulator [Actinocatenispora thailandica]